MTEEGGKAWRGAASTGYGKRMGSSEPGKEGGDAGQTEVRRDWGSDCMEHRLKGNRTLQTRGELRGRISEMN